jgi:hypothetical protein
MLMLGTAEKALSNEFESRLFTEHANSNDFFCEDTTTTIIVNIP